jgi:membrane protein YdbS with pleckstrin-like domain
MEKISLLPILGALAIYLKWNYASPFAPKPELSSKFWIVRSIPLLLLISAGILFTISLHAHDDIWIYIFSFGVFVLFLSPFVVFLSRRRKS